MIARSKGPSAEPRPSTRPAQVYQRQLSKEGLQAVVDGGSNKGGAGGGGGGQALMSMDQLRDLFTYDPQTLSSTYDSVVAGDTGRGSTAGGGGAVKEAVGGGGGGSDDEGDAVIPDSEEEESDDDDWQVRRSAPCLLPACGCRRPRNGS